MRKKLFKLSKLLLFATVLLMYGCASAPRGPAYTEIKTIPKNKAVVYFISSSIKSGEKRLYHCDNKPFGKIIHNKAYICKEVNPGKNCFKLVIVWGMGMDSSLSKPIDIDLQAGKVYYIGWDLLSKAAMSKSNEDVELKVLRSSDAISALKNCTQDVP